MSDNVHDAVDAILGEDPTLDSIANALRALAGAMEDLATLVQNFRTAISE